MNIKCRFEGETTGSNAKKKEEEIMRRRQTEALKHGKRGKKRKKTRGNGRRAKRQRDNDSNNTKEETEPIDRPTVDKQPPQHSLVIREGGEHHREVARMVGREFVRVFGSKSVKYVIR